MNLLPPPDTTVPCMVSYTRISNNELNKLFETPCRKGIEHYDEFFRFLTVSDNCSNYDMLNYFKTDAAKMINGLGLIFL